MNPIAEITLKNQKQIMLELFPDIAPNAVKSFIFLARQGIFDNYPIERIVPGWVIDVSYHAFHDKRACYFIENDCAGGTYLQAQFGTVGLGGYSGEGISGGEFFFPLADAPGITGRYPIFGKVTRGLEELRRLEGVATYPVPFYKLPEVKINTPVSPEFIESVRVETFGTVYDEPKRVSGERPCYWPTLL